MSLYKFGPIFIGFNNVKALLLVIPIRPTISGLPSGPTLTSWCNRGDAAVVCLSGMSVELELRDVIE